MAKSKRITNPAPIESFDSPWGGTYHTGDEQPVEGTVMKEGEEWGHTHSEVERVIKEKSTEVEAELGKKAGAFRWYQPSGENFYYLLAFTTAAEAEEWDKNQSLSNYIDRRQLPISTIQGDSYSARLATSIEDTSTPIVVRKQSLAIPLKFSAIKTSDGERINAGIGGTIIIERSTNGGQTYTRAGQVSLPSRDTDAGTYDSVDVGGYVYEGEQRLRFYAQYNYTDTDGTTRTATSQYVTLDSVTLTNMRLTFSANWHLPFSGDAVQVGYYVSGYGQMLLFVEVDGFLVVNGRTVTTSTETAVGVAIEKTTLMRAIGTENASDLNGLHTLRSWLAYASAPTVISDVVESQILYFDEATATNSQKQATYVMVSNMLSEVSPYVETKVLEYAVYKYGAESVSLTLLLTNANRTTTYLSHDLGSVPVGDTSPRTYRNALQLPRSINTAYLYFRANGTLQAGHHWALSVDQSIDYTPTEMTKGGFKFSASTRSNDEAHPEYIINELTGERVDAEWSQGMRFSPPMGYVEGGDEPKHLYIPAGEELRITGYDPFLNFESMTMELDVKVTDVYDEKIPVLRVGPETANGVLGFMMLPLTGFHMTREQTARGAQDFQMQEDERTHITLNVVKNLGNRGLNFVRIFINGTINREYIFGDDTFAPDGGSGGFVIGSPKAGICIYGISVYKQALSSHNVVQDYKSSISDPVKKLAFHRANDILGGDNTISYAKAKEQYSTMLWIPDDTSKPYVPNYTNGAASYSKGTLKVIFRYRFDTGAHKAGDVNYDLSRIYTHMKVKGQGTSSMTYWMWNWRFQFSDASEVWSLGTNLDAETLLLSNVGKEEDEWECYGIFEEGGAHATKLDAKCNWASSSQSHKMGMMNAYGALWKQIIGERDPIYAADRKTRPCVLQEAFMFFIQDASGAEQEGKIRFSNFFTFGPAKNDKATWGLKVPSPHYTVDGKQKSMYTLLEGSSNGRPLVEAKVPWIPDEVFYYFNTADVEDKMNETLIYNGDSQFDFDKGPSDTYSYGSGDEYDVPKGFTSVGNMMWKETDDMEYDAEDPYKTNGNTIKFYRRAWNFAYMNTHHLAAIEGDYNTLLSKAESSELNQGMQYFVMNDGGGHQKGDCFRYNPLSEKNAKLPKWVNAGAEKADTNDGYAVLNLLTDLATQLADMSYNVNDAISLTNALVKARLRRYRGDGHTTGSSAYWDENDCDLCQSWGKVMAAKDNWCKNTYFKLRPDGLLGMNRDDDDTIMDKDNVGKTGAPYQVEEHDRYNDAGEWADADGYGEQYDEGAQTYNVVDNPRNTYWNSQDSVLFTLREQTRGGVRNDMGNELQLMVGTIFQTMVQLEGSVDAFFQKYFFDIQEYFPAVAYNEVARLLYEEAKIQMSLGHYTNNTDPMTQSLGDQLQGEKQWLKRRIPYMESYGHSSVFANANGVGALSFRSSLATTDTGTTHGYAFQVTPHQFLYPSAGSESGYAFSDRRARPGEKVALPTLTVTQNNNVFIFGIDYLRSVGDFASHPTEPNSSMSIVGARLTEWLINESGAQAVQNRSAVISFTTPRLQRLIMRGCTALGSLGESSLTSLTQAVTIDLRGSTGLTSLRFPQTSALTTLELPATLTTLSLTGQPNLNTLTIAGYDALTQFTVTGSPLLGTSLRAHILNMKASRAPVSLIDISHIDWMSQPVGADVIRWLISVGDTGACRMSGSMAMVNGSDGILYFNDVCKLISRYGDIRDNTNDLYISFPGTPIAQSSMSIEGKKYINTDSTSSGYDLDEYGCFNDLHMLVVVGNDVGVTTKPNGQKAPNVRWELTDDVNGTYAEFEDPYSPVLHMIQTGASVRNITLNVKATLINTSGEERVVSKKIGLWNRIPEVGDYAWTDGEFDAEDDASKLLAGVVIKRDPVKDGNGVITAYDLTILAAADATFPTSIVEGGLESSWGVYPTGSLGFSDAKTNGAYDDSTMEAIRQELQSWVKPDEVSYAYSKSFKTDIFDTPLTDLAGTIYLRKDAAAVASAGNGFAMQDLSNVTNDGYNEVGAPAHVTNFDTEEENVVLMSFADAILSATYSALGITQSDYAAIQVSGGCDSTGVPLTTAGLYQIAEMIVQRAADMGVSTPSRFRELLFMAARRCRVWCPADIAGSAISESSLHESYRRGKWMLPSSGLLARVYNFLGNSRSKYDSPYAPAVDFAEISSGGAAINVTFESQKPIFANLIARGRPIPITPNGCYWSSTEYNRTMARNVGFVNGLASNFQYNTSNKYQDHVIRPVAAFTFVP